MRYIFTGFLFIFLGCSPVTLKLNQKPTNPKNPEEFFKAAKILFKSGKYKKTIELLRDYTLLFPSSPKIDSAEFLLAESYRKAHQYDQAISEFMFFINNFPASPLIVKAHLRLAQIYLEKSPTPELDQEDTYKSIELLRSFLSKYSDIQNPLVDTARELLKEAKEKLARKMLVAIVTYRNLGDLKSERYYLNLLFKEYPETQAYWEGKYYLLEHYLKKGLRDSATITLKEIL